MLGKHQTSQTKLPTLNNEGEVVVEPKAIIGTREKKLHSRVIIKYLIKWKSLLNEDASWETKDFRQQHPSLPML